jgi:hypothetical protein
MMKPFSPATLFVEAPPERRPLPAFAVSVLLHGVAAAGVVFGFNYPSRSSTEIIADRYTVRYLKLQPPESRRTFAGLQGPAVRTAGAAMKRAATRSQGGPSSTRRRFELPALTSFVPAKQTLIQLDAPPKVAMNQIAVPDLLLWAKNEVPPPRKQLVPPPPKDVPKPAASILAPPSLDVPNQEIKIADVRFSALPVSSMPQMPIQAATTSPVRIKGPEEGAQIPQTVSTNSSKESGAHIISLSSVPLRAESVIVLPLASQIASPGTQDGRGSGKGLGTGEASGGQAVGNEMANAKDTGANSGGNTQVTEGAGGTVQKPVAPAGTGASVAAGQPGDEAITEPVNRILLSRDGHFSVVVVGSSASEAYPDSVGLLTGKVVYTVYLKVGLRKSWILQYCLPGTVEQKFVVKGSATPLDSPFPFLMLRPHIAMGSDVDAVMVHGIVNTDGRFEQLALVLPGGFAQEAQLLASLRKWEFRPAKRDQQAIGVEVLLIIPRETD